MQQQEIFERLNRHCYCVGTNVTALHAGLDRRLREHGLADSMASSCPNLFSALPVFVSDLQRNEMQTIVEAIETVVALPAYRELVLNDAPAAERSKQVDGKTLLGYDFHLTHDGPKLIEINTNPGGALLSVEMLKAQQLCCKEMKHLLEFGNAEHIEQSLLEMFRDVWRTARGNVSLRTIAIVDEDPANQYLYPEFLLFKKLFELNGIEALIVAPTDLRYSTGKLTYCGKEIDLVYNRLTDFYFDNTVNHAIRDAYVNDTVVVTPSPVAHALFAHKLNLVTLTKAETLRSIGVSESNIAILVRGIPKTMAVKPDERDKWWLERKQWFFKPVAGFGSRGTYRGDKVTRKVFDEIMSGDYVAQTFSPPSERHLADDSSLKFDVRCYSYSGRIALLAARLYQGQTTNFRTPGGGFAPIYTNTCGEATSLVADLRPNT